MPLHGAQLKMRLADNAGDDFADAGDEAPHGRRVYCAGFLDLNSPARFRMIARQLVCPHDSHTGISQFGAALP